MAVGPADSVIVTQAGPAGQLGAQEQPVADAVRHGLLRHRADGHRRLAARHRPLRRRGHALQPAAVRPDDRRRPGGHEDGAGAAAHLAADAGAEVVHLDGRLRLQRRRLRHLRRGAGHRPLHPGGRVRARLPAAAGAVACSRSSTCRTRFKRTGTINGTEFAERDAARRAEAAGLADGRRPTRWWPRATSPRRRGLQDVIRACERRSPRHEARHDATRTS